MGNRAVITQTCAAISPCIYLHWNGGRDSVSAFLAAAKDLGLAGRGAPAMDDLAAMIARWMGTEVNKRTVYRELYGRADCDNWDNGVYIIDEHFDIIGRKFNPRCEQINAETTAAIKAQILEQQSVRAYITVKGVPLCQCEGHMAGMICRLNITCGYDSLAAADRAKREIQKHRHSVKVVRGECPAYAEEAARDA